MIVNTFDCFFLFHNKLFSHRFHFDGSRMEDWRKMYNVWKKSIWKQSGWKNVKENDEYKEKEKSKYIRLWTKNYEVEQWTRVKSNWWKIWQVEKTRMLHTVYLWLYNSEQSLTALPSNVLVINSSLWWDFSKGWVFIFEIFFSQSAAEGEWVVGPEEGLTLVQRVRQLLLVRLRQQHCGQTHLPGHQSEISEGKVRRPTAKVMLPKTKMGRTGWTSER